MKYHLSSSLSWFSGQAVCSSFPSRLISWQIFSSLIKSEPTGEAQFQWQEMTSNMIFQRVSIYF